MNSLNIVPDRLSITILHHNETFPTEVVLAFLRRLADLGHFEELRVGFIFYPPVTMIVPDPVRNLLVQEILRTASANFNLKVLDLSYTDEDLDWDPHLESILAGIKDHTSLHTFKVDVEDEAFGPDSIYLRQLLCCNRNVTVMSSGGHVYSDGAVIDELYALNCFYRRSVGLVAKPQSERSSLVANALVEVASSNFPRSSLLLKNHIDVLCELVQCADFDEDHEGDNSLSQTRQDRKRRRSV